MGKLKQRIHARLMKRLRQGMVAETRLLHARGISWKKLDDFGLEYRYAGRFARGLISKKDMIAAIERESAAYAKRQMTWWRKDKDIQWVKKPGEGARIAKNFLEGR